MNPNRFLNFGLGSSSANGQSSGGAGGSGNFLFDIIRVSRNFQFLVHSTGKFVENEHQCKVDFQMT